MLTIEVPETDVWDKANSQFVTLPGATLELEHSLVSLSKWEAKWQLPFLSTDDKTTEQTLDYIEMMCLTEVESPTIFKRLSEENVAKINDYLKSKMTATWFAETPTLPGGAPKRQETITSELIYYWLVSLQIPFETQYWHLNRLITLVRVINEKNKPEKKMSKADLAARNRMLNEQRKAKFKTAG